MKHSFTLLLLTVLLTGWQPLFAQTFIPIPVTGFNADIVAEAGNSALAATSTVIDGSNHVIHTTAFATANGITGGITPTGNFVNGTKTWQMAAFNTNNALYMALPANAVPNTVGVGTLTLTTPAVYSKLSLLGFATEGTATLSVLLTFTDGTTSNAGNISIKDWFNGTPAVVTGYGRITRTNAPMTVDGLTTNPRFYAFDFTIPCNVQSKTLASITFTQLASSGGTSRPLLLALSGVPFTPGTFTSSHTDAICGSANGSLTLTATAGSAPFTFRWNTTPVQNTAIATNVPAGAYIGTITDASGCIFTLPDTVKLVSSAVIVATANPVAICAGDPVTLSAAATSGTATDYSWTPGTLTGQTVTASPADTTDYIVSAKDAFGCIVKDTVTVAVKPTPTSLFTVSPTTICQGGVNTVTFDGTASAAATYNWHNFAGATVQSGTDAGPYQVSFPTAGNFDLQLQVTDDGCLSGITTQPVTVDAPPVVNVTVGKSPICAGDATTIIYTGTASANAVASWDFGGGTPQSGTDLGPYEVKYQTTGSVVLTVTDGVCTTVAAPATVTVIPMPVPAFTPDITEGCAPAVIIFDNKSRNADTYQWTFGDGANSTIAAPSHTYNNPGTYSISLTATAQGQCTATLTKNSLINIVPMPIALFKSSPLENTVVEFKYASFEFMNNSQDATTYEWDFGDGTSSTDMSPLHKYEETGDFRVTLYVTNDIGCTDSTSRAYYKVIPDLLLQIPNAFSPNGDGINDYWSVDGLKARPNATTEIYNRYGQIVFKGIGFAPWDGTWKGLLLPFGTYYYVIKPAPGEKTYAGWISLLR
jgi:gliding motility-associated-like protein